VSEALLSLRASVLVDFSLLQFLKFYFLESTMHFLLQHSSHELLIRSTSEAMENICSKGYDFLRSFFNPLLELVHRIEEASRHAQVMETSCQFILRACTHLINDLTEAELASKLNQLCEQSIMHLLKVCDFLRFLKLVPFYCIHISSVFTYL
jgi:hypothetical protein